jgi:hypothetical protein
MQEATGSNPVFSTALKAAFGWLFSFDSLLIISKKKRALQIEVPVSFL